jgi:23S rRNA (guanosine2251-2'-O)-methyltransferase
MNLGNLCRSAHAAGAQGLIIPRDRAAGVTPAVAKAAAGSLEYLAIYRVTNLADCLGKLKDTGLTVIGTAAEADISLYDLDLTGPLALVIGSEDKGLRPRVRRHCDLVAAIPMATPEVGSLNAATAGAVALFEARRQRLQKRGEKG